MMMMMMMMMMIITLDTKNFDRVIHQGHLFGVKCRLSVVLCSTYPACFAFVHIAFKDEHYSFFLCTSLARKVMLSVNKVLLITVFSVLNFSLICHVDNLNKQFL